MKHNILVKVFDEKYLLIYSATVILFYEKAIVIRKDKACFLLESSYRSLVVWPLGSDVNHGLRGK